MYIMQVFICFIVILAVFCYKNLEVFDTSKLSVLGKLQQNIICIEKSTEMPPQNGNSSEITSKQLDFHATASAHADFVTPNPQPSTPKVQKSHMYPGKSTNLTIQQKYAFFNTRAKKICKRKSNSYKIHSMEQLFSRLKFSNNINVDAQNNYLYCLSAKTGTTNWRTMASAVKRNTTIELINILNKKSNNNRKHWNPEQAIREIRNKTESLSLQTIKDLELNFKSFDTIYRDMPGIKSLVKAKSNDSKFFADFKRYTETSKINCKKLTTISGPLGLLKCMIIFVWSLFEWDF